MGSQAQIKFRDKSIGTIDHPVLIVGQNPGRQRTGEKTHVVWEGNRSADLLEWVLKSQTNIYLTNICNYQDITSGRLEEGKYDLQVLVMQLEPSKIICLGQYSYDIVSEMYKQLLLWPVGITNIRKLPHPSWIARFNKDRLAYKKLFIDILNT